MFESTPMTLDGFLANIAKFAPLVDLVLTVATVVIALYAVRGFRAQERVFDVNNCLMIKKEISQAWQQYASAGPQAIDREYRFQEALSMHEALCHLYNHKRFFGATRKMVEDYLKEVIEDLARNEFAIMQMRQYRSKPTTYQEILRFAARHRIPFPL